MAATIAERVAPPHDLPLHAVGVLAVVRPAVAVVAAWVARRAGRSAARRGALARDAALRRAVGARAAGGAVVAPHRAARASRRPARPVLTLLRSAVGVAAAESAVGAGGRTARRCALAGAAGLRAALAAGAAGAAVVALVRSGRAWGRLARTGGALLRGAVHVARADEALSAERGAGRAQAALTDARRTCTVRGASLADGAGRGTDGWRLFEGLVRPDVYPDVPAGVHPDVPVGVPVGVRACVHGGEHARSVVDQELAARQGRDREKHRCASTSLSRGCSACAPARQEESSRTCLAGIAMRRHAIRSARFVQLIRTRDLCVPGALLPVRRAPCFRMLPTLDLVGLRTHTRAHLGKAADRRASHPTTRRQPRRGGQDEPLLHAHRASAALVVARERVERVVALFALDRRHAHRSTPALSSPRGQSYALRSFAMLP